MSPLFGHKDEHASGDQGNSALQAEVDRLGALPIDQLAAEVMTRGFGPGGPGDDDDAVTVGGPNVNSGPDASDIAALFRPEGQDYNVRMLSVTKTFDDLTADEKLCRRCERLVAEGLQALEHASLVRAQLHTETGYLDWTATRLGRAALQQGTVARALAAGPPAAT